MVKVIDDSAAAIAGTRIPFQDREIICARRIQSAGACRAPASLRILRSSTTSTGGRANSSFGMVDHHHGATSGRLIQPRIEERSTSTADGVVAATTGFLPALGLLEGVDGGIPVVNQIRQRLRCSPGVGSTPCGSADS